MNLFYLFLTFKCKKKKKKFILKQIKKWYALFFKPISANINHGNHDLPWAPHRLLP